MNYRIDRALLAGAAIAMAWSAAATVRAETQSDTATVEAAEVSTGRVFVAEEVVTASKSDTPIIRLPRSVSVITAAEMRNRGVDTVTEIFQYTPGFNGDAYGSGSLSRVYSNVRGFLALQYQDGLKLHDSNWGIEPFGLQSAELLRGPASALYGQTNPGGLINLTSKRPTAIAFGDAEIQVGSYNRLQGALDFGGPIDKDGKVLFRMTALLRSADGLIGHTRDQRVYIAPALTVKLGEKTDITFLASLQRDPDLTVFQYLPRVGTIVDSPFGRIARNTFVGVPSYDGVDKQQDQIGYQFEHRFSDALTFRQNFRYTYIDIKAPFTQVTAIAADQRTATRAGVYQVFDINIAQIDNQLAAKFDTGALAHSVTAGLDYAYLPVYQGTGQGTAPSVDLYAPNYNVFMARPIITTKRQTHQRQTGLYLQDQVTMGGFTLLAGVRHDWATTTTRNRNAITGIAPNDTLQNDKAFSGQAGLIYTFANGLAPYVSYSHSFFPTAGADFAGKPLLPAVGDQYEGGIKYQPPGMRALFTAAVYNLTQDNVRTNDLAHPGFTIQTGQVRSRGVELEAHATVWTGLNVAASYTYMENLVTRSNTTNLNKIPQDRPKNQASLWADYAVPALSGLTLGAGVKYVGKSWGDTTNTFEVPAYTTVDALVRYDFYGLRPSLKGWDISVNTLNLLDKTYVSNCDSAINCFYAQGRMVKATLRRQW